MKAIKIINQSQNDLTLAYECEFCGHAITDYGYNDSFFFNEVIPNKVCPKCGRNTTCTNCED